MVTIDFLTLCFERRFRRKYNQKFIDEHNRAYFFRKSLLVADKEIYELN